MSTFREWKSSWIDKDPNHMDKIQMGELKGLLRCVKEDELEELEDYKDYIRILNIFRQAIDTDELRGTNYKETIRSLLSQGEAGMYDGKLRFLYELIQNADDCSYPDDADCFLTIGFDEKNGCIYLLYNEMGFTPENVFAITGTAEAVKNITAENMNIGEKGIGFKAVFGVADEVLIQSGMFSFKISVNDPSIPILAYDDYEPIKGTKLTLYMDGLRVSEYYQELFECYGNPESLLSKNPIMFLNKLTRLYAFVDFTHSMTFKTTKTLHSQNEEIRVYDYKLSVLCSNGNGENYKREVKCWRLEKIINYDQDMIDSRYGKDTKLVAPRSMKLAVVFPKLKYLGQKPGVLYSFFPTQIELNIPAYCHVPFKLDGSREHVDPHPREDNKAICGWFIHSCKELASLLQSSFLELSRLYGEYIILYLPAKSDNSDNYYVKKAQNSEECLRNEYLTTNDLFEKCLFLCTDNTYQKMADCIVIDHQKAEEAYALLKEDKHLFMLPKDVEGVTVQWLKSKFNICVISDVLKRLFNQALDEKTAQPESLAFINDDDDERIKNDISTVFLQSLELRLSVEDVQQLSKYEKVWKLVKKESFDAIQNRYPPRPFIKIVNSQNVLNILDGFFPDEKISKDEIDSKTNILLSKVNYKYVVADLPKDDYLVANNSIVLSKNDPFYSFCSLSEQLDKSGQFLLNMKLRRSYAEFDKISNGEIQVSDQEFLNQLILNRKNVKTVLGKTAYDNYITLIQDARINSSGFINELLQNADDLDFEDPMPTFIVEEIPDGIRSYCNEVGFTQNNVRAITAIGDSTKKRIKNGSRSNETGEKGIGFKSVFSVFSEVQIDSGAFHFTLSKGEPTIPRLISGQPNMTGTAMKFTGMAGSRSVFSLPDTIKLLELCLALKRLRHIIIGKHTIKISDKVDQRTLEIDGTKYCFDKISRQFDITDSAALDERNAVFTEHKEEDKSNIGKGLNLTLYVPHDDYLHDCPLYNCLPTTISTAIPLAIDAPYMLDTSRERVLGNNKWNTLITSEVFMAVIGLIEDRVKSIGIDALKYIKVSSGDVKIYQGQNNESLKCKGIKDTLVHSSIIPTKMRGHIVTPSCGDIYYVPSVLHTFLHAGGKLSLKPEQIVEACDSKYENVLEYLGIKFIDASDTCKILADADAQIMDNDEFRNSLYNWLCESTISRDDNYLKKIPLIPVLERRDAEDKYISIDTAGDNLYVMADAEESGEDYWILNVKILSCEKFNSIFKKTPFAMNDDVRRERYISSLSDIVTNPERFYTCYNENKANWQRWQDRISPQFKSKVCFRMRDGHFSRMAYRCFNGKIKGPFVDYWSVDPAWDEFAGYFRKPELRNIEYSNVSGYEHMLTDEDMFAICRSGYFVRSEELEKEFIRHSQISQELIEKYDLGLLKGKIDEENNRNKKFDFPAEKPGDLLQLQKVDALLQNPVIVNEVQSQSSFYCYKREDGVCVTISRTQKDECESSTLGALVKSYTPKETTSEKIAISKENEKCFCQMCGEVFYPEYLTSAAIIYVAEEYYPQLYIVLCQRCKRKLDDQKKIAGYCQLIHDAFVYGKNSGNDDKIQVDVNNSYLDPFWFLPSHYKTIQKIICAKREKLSLSYSRDDCQRVMETAPASSISVGDHVTFGRYYLEKDDDVMRPLEWQITAINEGRDEISLITVRGIDCVPYNNGASLCVWKESQLHNWLNKKFFQTAFTNEEQGRVKECTSGFVRLLNQEEAKRLKERKLLPTGYALAKGAKPGEAKLNGEKTCWWWLQDGGVSRSGEVSPLSEKPVRKGKYTHGYDYYTGSESTGAVRPFIVIKGKDCLKKSVLSGNVSLSEEQKKIMGFLRQRDVIELVHFTPVENLESILKNGLVSHNRAIGLGGKCTDPLRLDGHPDTISLSITEPNEWMRGNKEDQGFKLVLLHIKVEALLLIPVDCIGFYPKNAASSEYRNDLSCHTGAKNLMAMFADSIIDKIEHKRTNKPDSYPTSPQAEILYRGTIPIECITRISARGIPISQSLIDEYKKKNISIEP